MAMDDRSDNLELKLALVKKQTCFTSLTPDESKNLAKLFTQQEFKMGDIIVTEGDPVDSVFLVAKGKAEVRQAYVKDNKIQTKVVASIGPGESIGLNETGFYSLTGRRTATVVALSDMITLKLIITEFHGFALANSHVSEVMRKNADSISGWNS